MKTVPLTFCTVSLLSSDLVNRLSRIRLKLIQQSSEEGSLVFLIYYKTKKKTLSATRVDDLNFNSKSECVRTRAPLSDKIVKLWLNE